jgi:hypothetical protein
MENTCTKINIWRKNYIITAWTIEQRKYIYHKYFTLGLKYAKQCFSTVPIFAEQLPQLYTSTAQNFEMVVAFKPPSPTPVPMYDFYLKRFLLLD